MAGLIFESEAAHYVPYLALSIAKNESTAAREVLGRMAQDERPWLWWKALGLDAAKVALGDRAAWPREIVVREMLVSGLREEDAERDAEAFEEARTLLPGIVTLDFALADAGSFRRALQILTEKCDRERATDAMIGFMTAARDYRKISRNVLEMVRTINKWHGVDIGGIGSEGKVDAVMLALNCRQIAMEAAEWRRTGQVVTDVFPGYTASKGAFRVVLFDKDKPERSLVSLWCKAERPGVTDGVRMIRDGDRALVYTMSPIEAHDFKTLTASAPPEWELGYRLFVKGERLTYFRDISGGHRFAVSQLPVSAGIQGDPSLHFMVAVEDATSDKSVLSGTKVFDEWWEKYGPSPAGESGAPAFAE